jgi:hypothetical protein
VILKSIQDMSRFQGTGGNFQVVVGLRKEATLLPAAVRGRCILFGAGSVNAYVDLGQGREERMPSRSDIARPKRSYVVAEQRGFFDRIVESSPS